MQAFCRDTRLHATESLEPRLMMDAEPLDSALEPNLDMEQFNKFDFTQFGLADKANAAVLNIFLQFNADPQFAKADGTN